MTQAMPAVLMARGACSRLAVVRQLPGILGVQVAGGDDDVGVDVVTVFEYRTSCFHGVQTSLGSVMWPVRALAAAVAGLAR